MNGASEGHNISFLVHCQSQRTYVTTPTLLGYDPIHRMPFATDELITDFFASGDAIQGIRAAEVGPG